MPRISPRGCGRFLRFAGPDEGGGVGIQNKILQSMAFRVPVVATTRGLGGIQAKPGRDILIADSPLEFAEGVIALMEDPALREDIRKMPIDW